MSDINEKIDLRGEICPYPILYLEPKLKKMSSEKTLEVIVDHICAVEGIESFVKKLGHEVLSSIMIDNGLWRILVKTKKIN